MPGPHTGCASGQPRAWPPLRMLRRRLASRWRQRTRQQQEIPQAAQGCGHTPPCRRKIEIQRKSTHSRQLCQNSKLEAVVHGRRVLSLLMYHQTVAHHASLTWHWRHPWLLRQVQSPSSQLGRPAPSLLLHCQQCFQRHQGSASAAGQMRRLACCSCCCWMACGSHPSFLLSLLLLLVQPGRCCRAVQQRWQAAAAAAGSALCVGRPGLLLLQQSDGCELRWLGG